MPFKVWSIGEEVFAADFNPYVQQQVVARFASAAARTSAITSPVLNQLTELDNRPGIVQYWTGSAWADIGGATFVQSGGQSITLNTFGQATITFPVSFGGGPLSFLAQVPYVSPTLIHVVGVQGTLSATACNVQATNAAGTPLGAVTIGVWWMATGPRP